MEQNTGVRILLHVSYESKDKERPISLPNGSTLKELVEKFLKTFNDLIPPHSKGSDFIFSVYHPKIHAYIKLKSDDVLHDGDKIKVNYVLQDLGPVVQHAIHAGMSYYFWSTFSDGLLKLHVPSMTVKCNGTTADHSDIIHFKAVDVNTAHKTLRALTLPGSTQGKVYVMKGQGENHEVIMEEMEESQVTSSLPDEYKFECYQYFGDTRFKCESGTNLFVTAMKDATVQLLKSQLSGYPRPNTLFIASYIF